MSTSEAIPELRTKKAHESGNNVHALQGPHEVVSEFNQFYNHWRAGQPYNPDEIDVFMEDWDNLLILDACCYDEFTCRSNLPGKTEHRISHGNTSPEFVCGNFGGKWLPDIITEDVESLLNDLLGKTVVTADHGELLGDRERPIPVTLYRHPEGVYVDSLVKVPWHVYQNGERRDIVAEQPTETTDDFDIEQIEQNLRDLGYRT